MTKAAHQKLQEARRLTGRTLGSLVDELLGEAGKADHREVAVPPRACHEQMLVKVTPVLAHGLKQLRRRVNARRESDVLDAVAGGHLDRLLAAARAGSPPAQPAEGPCVAP